MRGVHFLGLVALISACSPPAESSDSIIAHPERIAFLSQCKFPNGVRIVLIHRFNSASYRFIIRDSDMQNDISTLTPKADGTIDLDTNGGIGKMDAVDHLFNWLLQQKFDAVPPEKFSAQLRRTDLPACPGKYPFSP